MATQTFVTDLQAMNPTVVQVHQVNNNVSLPMPNRQVNPYLTNGFSHHYHLDESIFICRGVRSDFYFFVSFFDEFTLCKQNSPRWDAALYGGTSGAILFAYVP